MLLLAEGFESQADSGTDFTYTGPVATWCNCSGISPYISGGTDGGQCRCIVQNSSNNYQVEYNFTPQTAIVIGFYYWVSGSSYATRNICGFYSSTGGGWLAGLFGDSGVFKLYNNNQNTIVAVGGSIPTSTWFHVELKIIVGSGTSGSIECRINGIANCAAVGINTNYNNTGSFEQINFNCPFQNVFLDDIVISNMTGGAPFNDWLGPVYVKRLQATAVGTYDQFTNIGAWTKLGVVNQDRRATTNANMLQAGTELDGNVIDIRQSFSYGTPAANYTILAVQHNPFCWCMQGKNYEARSFALMGNAVSYQTIVMNSSDWRWQPQTFLTAPDGSAWTTTNLQNTQFGIQLHNKS